MSCDQGVPLSIHSSQLCLIAVNECSVIFSGVFFLFDGVQLQSRRQVEEMNQRMRGEETVAAGQDGWT